MHSAALFQYPVSHVVSDWNLMTDPKCQEHCISKQVDFVLVQLFFEPRVSPSVVHVLLKLPRGEHRAVVFVGAGAGLGCITGLERYR